MDKDFFSEKDVLKFFILLKRLRLHFLSKKALQHKKKELRSLIKCL